MQEQLLLDWLAAHHRVSALPQLASLPKALLPVMQRMEAQGYISTNQGKYITLTPLGHDTFDPPREPSLLPTLPGHPADARLFRPNHKAKPMHNALAQKIMLAAARALGRPPFPIYNITFGDSKMSGSTQGQGTNIGTFTAPVGDHSVNFNAAIVQGTDDNTPPQVTLLGGAQGTVNVGPKDPSGAFYPVTVSNLADNSTSIIQIEGDNIDDCYLTVIIQPPAKIVEDFTVDPSTVTFSA